MCALALATLHLSAGTLRFLEGIPRSRWLSAAGGVVVAYVFVHLLPDVAEAGEAISRSGFLPSLERHAYVLALVGLAVFYSLEHIALVSRRRTGREGATDKAERRVLWLHVASFAAYNGLIGYLVVHRAEDGAADLLLFTGAIAVHFLVADFGLDERAVRAAFAPTACSL